MLEGSLATADAPILLHHFFANSVRRWPARTAVDVPPGHGRPERRLTTYAELARQADAVSGARGRWGAMTSWRFCCRGIRSGSTARNWAFCRRAARTPDRSFVPGRADREILRRFGGGSAAHRPGGRGARPQRGIRGAHSAGGRTLPAEGALGRPNASLSRPGQPRIRDLHFGHYRAAQGRHDRAPKHRQPGGFLCRKISADARRIAWRRLVVGVRFVGGGDLAGVGGGRHAGGDRTTIQ
jgi:hypothetical protein